MKERPILFSGPMVRALLDGRKTQTRRVVKNQPAADVAPICVSHYHPTVIDRRGEEAPGAEIFGAYSDDGEWGSKCPYGQPGDRLWVRESFWGCDMPGYGDQPCVVYEDEWHGKEYRAAEIRPYARKFGHIPAIHMPRDCSRITLEIVDVRIERLNDITDADAEAEGWPGFTDDNGLDSMAWYSDLWDGLNMARGYGWDVNPWVWVVEFKRA